MLWISTQSVLTLQDQFPVLGAEGYTFDEIAPLLVELVLLFVLVRWNGLLSTIASWFAICSRLSKSAPHLPNLRARNSPSPLRLLRSNYESELGVCVVLLPGAGRCGCTTPLGFLHLPRCGRSCAPMG